MSKGVSEQGGGVQIKSSPKIRCEKAREKKCSVHVGFMDLRKAYDRVNMEAL